MKRWFDRTFELGLPVERLPQLLERLRSAPDRLEALVRACPAAILTRRDGDRWSIQENAGHLLDLEPLGEGRREDFVQGRESLRPADLENRRTHEAAHNDASMDEILRAFRAARAHFVAGIEAMTNEDRERTALHPRLRQPMRITDLAFFAAEHDDHHLGRIRELIASFRSVRK